MRKQLKVKIVSDGTAWGTKVVDEETNMELHNVTKIEWVAEAGHFCTAKLTLVNIPVDIKSEVVPDEVRLVVKGHPTPEDIQMAQEIQDKLDKAPK